MTKQVVPRVDGKGCAPEKTTDIDAVLTNELDAEHLHATAGVAPELTDVVPFQHVKRLLEEALGAGGVRHARSDTCLRFPE